MCFLNDFWCFYDDFWFYGVLIVAWRFLFLFNWLTTLLPSNLSFDLFLFQLTSSTAATALDLLLPALMSSAIHCEDLQVSASSQLSARIVLIAASVLVKGQLSPLAQGVM